MTRPDFYPPRLNRILVRAVQTIAPWVAYGYYRLQLDVDSESLKILTQLRDRRVLLLPNHPTFHDPIVVFLLSGTLGQTYYYLAAHEQIQSAIGGFLQTIGGYSIRRGLADRASIAQTLDLLTQPGCHLVIFPEGGCSFQNDTVMPFRSGAVQLAFQAMSKQVRRGDAVPDLYAVPVSIKYRYTRDMTRSISETLTHLEQSLNLSVPALTNPYHRLRAIAERVLTQIEQEYGLQSAEQPWNQRIVTLKQFALEQSEQQLNLTSAEGELDRERVYRIQNALQTQLEAAETNERPQALQPIQRSVFRLLNFDAIYDGYVAAQPTPERFMDTLVRLEREVFNVDQPAPKGHRLAQLRVGEPINLKQHFDDYSKHRSQTVDTLIARLQQTAQANLDRLLTTS